MDPRMKSPIVTGTSVTLRRLAAAMANVFVNASGLNSRPSCPSSAKTGRKLTVMMRREKKSAGPTSFALVRVMAQTRERGTGNREPCLR
jgi:hypothetical protein